MTRGWLFAIGLGAYVLVLIATLPATFADSVLQLKSNGRLRIVEATGTLWSGGGRIEFRDADGRNSAAKNIHWRCLPWSLIGGHLIIDIGVEQSPHSFPLTVSFAQVEISNADINLPAAVLGLAIPKLAPLGLGGEVLLHVTGISLQHGQLRGNAILQWRSASSALTSVAPLGDYELRLDGDAVVTHATLSTLQGPVIIEGRESLMAGAESAFLATLRVPAPLQQQLAPLLRLLAVERDEGVFELRIK